MKYFLIIIAVIATISLTSCEVSDDGLRVSYDVVAIDSVQMPASFNFGQTYEIPVFYNKPTDCHVFEGFNISQELNIRNISTVLARLDSGGCIDGQFLEQQTLRFTAASNGSYVFRFFTGLNANNEETFLEYTVQVLE
ncbi:hypothetical protein [Nonlabens sp.]|uniref:hypothetical protein n=1 Tax=Nonlabens sp. TaxID=1888209 RepID=UPI003F6A2E22